MSEQFIVSARKYRPQTFDTVIGQGHITTTLKNAIRSQQLAHAYLFCGPRGVGKTTCARILAKTINCENPTAATEACGECSTCISFQNNTSFNVFELDAASNNSVEDIRELVNQVRFAPQHGKYKIYIIDEVHMLSTAAFNAFLKTLEEPPPYAIFILATTEKHKILPTILSRCQIFDFKRITTNDVVHHLEDIATREQVQADEEGLHLIALKSEGCMRDALSMFDRIVSFTNGQLSYALTTEHLNILDAEFYFRLGDMLLAKDVAGTLLLLDEIMDKGFEGNVVLEGLAEYYRNLLLCKDVRMVKLLDVAAAHKQQFFEKANITPAPFVLNALNMINQFIIDYRIAPNKRLQTETCLIKLCFLSDMVQPQEKKNFEPASIAQASNNIAAPMPPPAAQVNAPAPLPAPAFVNNSEETIRTADKKVVQENSAVNTEEPKSTWSQKPSDPTENAPAEKTSFLNKPKAGQASRLSTNILDQLNNTVLPATNEPVAELTQERVLEVFAWYMESVKNDGKNTYSAYLTNVLVEVIPPDTVKLVCNDPMAETFIRGHHEAFVTFFTGHLKRRILIEILLVENENTQEQRVLSKQEMFQAMLNEHENLRLLNEKFRLHIE